MKEKIFNFTFCLFSLLSLIFIFNHNHEVSMVIISATNLFFQKVFVSLFPMFILNDLLINLGLPYYFYKIFSKIFIKFFHTSGLSAYCLIMSLISGTPSNAYILKNLVNDNLLTPAEASHYLYFTYFSNPLFLNLTLSTIFPNPVVLKIIVIHYLSNIFIALLKRNKAPQISDSTIPPNSKANIPHTLISSLQKSINTLLLILGTIVFFKLLSFILTNLFPLNKLTQVLLSCFLEITNGLNLLSTLNISLKLKEIIALATISFGGLSIHTQIKSILEDTSISYQKFFKGRIYHVLISILLIIIF